LGGAGSWHEPGTALVGTSKQQQAIGSSGRAPARRAPSRLTGEPLADQVPHSSGGRPRKKAGRTTSGLDSDSSQEGAGSGWRSSDSRRPLSGYDRAQGRAHVPFWPKPAAAADAGIDDALVCQVPGCGGDLSHCKDYHQRHRICEVHFKAPQVASQLQLHVQHCLRLHLQRACCCERCKHSASWTVLEMQELSSSLSLPTTHPPIPCRSRCRAVRRSASASSAAASMSWMLLRAAGAAAGTSWSSITRAGGSGRHGSSPVPQSPRLLWILQLLQLLLWASRWGRRVQQR
jgi:hypothetical protein